MESLTDSLSVEEAAHRLGVSGQTIRRRIRDGKLAAVKVHGPKGAEWRIPKVGELADQEETAMAVTMPLMRAEDLGSLLAILREKDGCIESLHAENVRLHEELAVAATERKLLSAPVKRPWWKFWAFRADEEKGAGRAAPEPRKKER